MRRLTGFIALLLVLAFTSQGCIHYVEEPTPPGEVAASQPVAKGDRQSVRRILLQLIKRDIQHLGNHTLNLYFRCISLSHDGLLYFAGRVFSHRDRLLHGGQENDAPDVSQPQRRFGVLTDKNFFHCYSVRLDTSQKIKN